FNYRVLDQAKSTNRNIFERLKFLAITCSNLDEFFMIRVGSLYNYLDYGKQRIDYSGLREEVFRIKLFTELQQFVNEQYRYFKRSLVPQFKKYNFKIADLKELTHDENKKVSVYFKKTVYPMLTPMLTDAYRTFPLLRNKALIFGVVTQGEKKGEAQHKKISFVQVPRNLPRFFEIEREEEVLFIPIEQIIQNNIKRLFRNVDISSVNLFRITRNADYAMEESDDSETRFIDELKHSLKSRKTGRVVRLEIEPNCSKWLLKKLKEIWQIDDYNVFFIPSLMDFTCLWQIINHDAFSHAIPPTPEPVPPASLTNVTSFDIFHLLRKQDVLLHHPFNSIEPLLELLEAAAVDPNVLAIKMTIYRLAKDSRVTSALLKAAENGKHVSALFEVKARFDEENNLKEAEKLQEAGCFVIHGLGQLKTHTKILMVIRKEDDKITRYLHMGSGNYNESTAKLYTDVGLLTAKEEYAQDVSEFFNAITGHSQPARYEHLITAPLMMRKQLIELISREAAHAKEGKECGIVIKINSLQDDKTIEALYEASQAGVPIKLIVRGICCLRPGRKGLSENIEIRSLVGDYLEHSRIFYFHNNDNPTIYGGSADVMVRSFDRRIESLFEFIDEKLRQEAINLLVYNLLDNVNAYQMQEDGTYVKIKSNRKPAFNSQKEFYKVTPEVLAKAKLFDKKGVNIAQNGQSVNA
ncbi:MAG: polyphosphate kinase 1, partial [Flammeovirgaceae bacterium]